ncbi:MAG: hypothetical protein K8S14_03165 [Actinomycetia bacterium]|nr:hypothetical protein [Actinomycetes bacterium]
MIREDLFKKIDMFDENYKLYCEDMDLCLRVKENKFKIFFIPESKIIHHRGWMKRSFESLNFYFTSHAYYYKKNFRGTYKNMLLLLNKIEWSYEKLFFLIKSKKR